MARTNRGFPGVFSLGWVSDDAPQSARWMSPHLAQAQVHDGGITRALAVGKTKAAIAANQAQALAPAQPRGPVERSPCRKMTEADGTGQVGDAKWTGGGGLSHP
ncbi:hypothetical protein GGTG_02927 [Gaeumannomyces tritici R3-111a-1]|uniref:Uncharacterized protein n=1 Tax=Gaeumannomyces tritici (strain R3-111a-1) TaxID=644352 RepID=J3NNR9_GAET3|nr:hypothetical protein GGTG_02927 [Gaeumannomyces tritici R3-111a-1]EJT77822.1 hypothetical protein GGTG_02927 [Gaeumannomyces tritici R3-111a-1]